MSKYKGSMMCKWWYAGVLLFLIIDETDVSILNNIFIETFPPANRIGNEIWRR